LVYIHIYTIEESLKQPIMDEKILFLCHLIRTNEVPMSGESRTKVPFK